MPDRHSLIPQHFEWARRRFLQDVLPGVFLEVGFNQKAAVLLMTLVLEESKPYSFQL